MLEIELMLGNPLIEGTAATVLIPGMLNPGALGCGEPDTTTVTSVGLPGAPGRDGTDSDEIPIFKQLYMMLKQVESNTMGNLWCIYASF
jgi:hypothetical protein